MGWYDAVLGDASAERDHRQPDPDTCLIPGTFVPDPVCVARKAGGVLPKPPVLVPGGGSGVGTLVLGGLVLWWLLRRRR